MANKHDQLALRFIQAAPAELEGLVESLAYDAVTLDALARHLDSLAIAAAGVAAYVSERSGDGCGDQGHEIGVETFNAVRSKVRTALGYTYSRNDINF